MLKYFRYEDSRVVGTKWYTRMIIPTDNAKTQRTGTFLQNHILAWDKQQKRLLMAGSLKIMNTDRFTVKSSNIFISFCQNFSYTSIMIGSAPSLLLVTRVTMVSVSVLFVMVSVTLPNWVGTAGNWNSLSAPPTGSGCLTLMTILEPGCWGSGWTKWAGIMAWNCSLVTCFGTSSPDGKAKAFFAVGSGDGSTFPLFLSGDAARNCCRADWLTLGELLTRHYYMDEGHERRMINFLLPCSQRWWHGTNQGRRRHAWKASIIRPVGHITIGAV